MEGHRNETLVDLMEWAADVGTLAKGVPSLGRLWNQPSLADLYKLSAMQASAWYLVELQTVELYLLRYWQETSGTESGLLLRKISCTSPDGAKQAWRVMTSTQMLIKVLEDLHKVA